jgi:DNA-directed RNA polymerase subunit alpha
LSSIQGYAITSVRITTYDENGISHVISSEFDNIPNVSEDTLEIIDSLKKVRLVLPEDAEQATFLYEFKGPGVVKSQDFIKEGQLDVTTKDLVLFTMMEGAHLDIEIQVELGRGYVPAEVNKKRIDNEIIGTIPMDAIFTPITRVRYSIKPCLFGQRNDYDLLELEVFTDGTIAPANALAEAAKIAKEHFAIFINFNEKDVIGTDEDEEGDQAINAILNTDVQELELSVRSSNCLRNANIRTIGELTRKTEDDIAKFRNFGKKSLAEIKEKLVEWNLSLGMTDYSHLKNAANLRKQKEETDES